MYCAVTGNCYRLLEFIYSNNKVSYKTRNTFLWKLESLYVNNVRLPSTYHA